MSKNEEIGRQISQALKQADHIAVIAHVRPDGDAVGALTGLGLSLKAAGKDVQMVLVDGLPSDLRHLPGSKQILRKPMGSVDLHVVLDCSDLQRTGMEWETPPGINIDHHITNLNFARLNYVDPEAVATCAILAERLEGWGFPITSEVANSLLTGIISDTLGFRTSNTNPLALRLAASMMERGADLPELYNQALMRRSFEAARFWGEGLGNLQRDNGLIWTTLHVDDRIKVNYPGNDDADLVNFLSTIDDSEIVVIFVEQKEGAVKVSWRAQPGWDVSQLALQFGGGGHPAAAGAMINGPLEQVQEQVLQATRSILAGRPDNNGNTAAAEGGGSS